MQSFNDFSEAFDFCREGNKPLTVLIKGGKWKLFPSGRAERGKQILKRTQRKLTPPRYDEVYFEGMEWLDSQ